MGAPKIYRWDDDNAPVMRGEREAMVEVLTACLVDGYGDKTAAGWTREFVNAEGTKAAFRNNPVTGTGMFLQVDGASYSSKTGGYLEGFEAMSDLDNGTGRFVGDKKGFYMTSQTVGTTARPWVMFADDRFFMIFVWMGVTNVAAQGFRSCCYVFGDAIPVRDADPYLCVIHPLKAMGTWAGYFPLTVSAAVESNQNYYVARNLAGDAGVHRWGLVHGGGPSRDGVSGAYGPARSDGKIYLSRPFINDGTAYSAPRGYIPGVYCVCNLNQGFDNFETLTYGEKEFMFVKCQGGSSHQTVAIDISESWRP